MYNGFIKQDDGICFKTFRKIKYIQEVSKRKRHIHSANQPIIRREQGDRRETLVGQMNRPPVFYRNGRGCPTYTVCRVVQIAKRKDRKNLRRQQRKICNAIYTIPRLVPSIQLGQAEIRYHES